MFNVLFQDSNHAPQQVWWRRMPIYFNDNNAHNDNWYVINVSLLIMRNICIKSNLKTAECSFENFTDLFFFSCSSLRLYRPWKHYFRLKPSKWFLLLRFSFTRLNKHLKVSSSHLAKRFVFSFYFLSPIKCLKLPGCISKRSAWETSRVFKFVCFLNKCFVKLLGLGTVGDLFYSF